MMQITINFQDGTKKTAKGKYIAPATQVANRIISQWAGEQYAKTGKTQRPSVVKNGNVWTVTSVNA